MIETMNEAPGVDWPPTRSVCKSVSSSTTRVTALRGVNPKILETDGEWTYEEAVSRCPDSVGRSRG